MKSFALPVMMFFLFSCTAHHFSTIPAIRKQTTTSVQIPYHPLQTKEDLTVLINAIDTAKIVLLGEASHGTSEYYTWRAAISKRLIEEKGFRVIAVEGDWSDGYKVNNFIKGEREDSNAVIKLLKEYNRWPTWLWANYEVASFVKWLNEYNQSLTPARKVGFYGLDLFNIAEAADELNTFLNPADTAALNAVKKFHQCFSNYANDELKYSSSPREINTCKETAGNLLKSVQALSPTGRNMTEHEFATEQSALVAFNGEAYLGLRGNSVDAWNFRDNHMLETINRLITLNGPGTKLIIWAHNNHVGDSRYATMHWEGKVSLGFLLRQKYGDKNVFITGAGSYSGSILAAEKWGAPSREMPIAFADDSTWEQKMHQLNARDKIIISKEIKDQPAMLKWISHMGIGVTYHPLDRTGIYTLSVMPNKYDAFLFFDVSHALHPIATQGKEKGTFNIQKEDY